MPGLTLVGEHPPTQLRPTWLQWRAGHVPGLTKNVGRQLTCPAAAILQWRAGHVPGLTTASPKHGILRCHDDPSMEGRARARPDADGTEAAADESEPTLQWRAGHVPGLTAWRHAARPHCASPAPSMEGRARARPDVLESTVAIALRVLDSLAEWRPFNGGPGTCPA